MKDKHSPRANGRGFTIVELLIVIVIIGILAAITIVAYNGVQQRAANARTIALVNGWEKTIRMYQVTSGLLPNDWTCLGTSTADFPAEPTNSVGLGVCEENLFTTLAGRTSEYKTVPTTGMTQPTPDLLRANASSAPGATTEYWVGPNQMVRGIVYASISDPQYSPNGLPGAYILYALKGQACPNNEGYTSFGSLNICGAKLTTSNYRNEIYQPS